MIKYPYKLFLVAIFSFVSSITHAEVSDASIDKLLELSGLTMQVEQFPGLIKAGMEEAKAYGAPIPDAEFSSMVYSIDEWISPSEIISGIRASVKNTINEQEARKLLAWYESDLGKEITRAEKSASTPEAYQQMVQSAQSLMADSERVEFANRLDELLGATDMTMDLQKSTGLAVYSAIFSALQPGTSVDMAQFEDEVDAENARARPDIKKLITVSFLYSYKDIAMDDLKKYESFLSDSATMKFNKTIMSSMNRELGSSVSKWAEKLAEIFIRNNQPV